MKARVRVTNGFLNNSNLSTFFLSCYLLEGDFKTGEFLIVDELNKWKILNIDKPRPDLPFDRILTIGVQDTNIKISSLYGNEYIVQ